MTGRHDDEAAPQARRGHAASREARLAAALRENLHRRKAQARALDACGPAAPTAPDFPKDD